MKKRLLILLVLSVHSKVVAVDPPKLVPRPIPGMADPTMTKPEALSANPVVTQQAVNRLLTNTDRARVLYIHRRATLPVELTKNLPTSRQTPTVSTFMLNVRENAVRIIPKSEVSKRIVPKP